MVSKSSISAAKVFMVLDYVLSGIALLLAFAVWDKTGMFDFSDAHMTTLGGLLALLFLPSIPMFPICVIASIILLFVVHGEKKVWNNLAIAFLILVICFGVYWFVGISSTSR